MDKDLQDLLDRAKIRQCTERLARGEDRRDADLISASWWPDATYDYGVQSGDFASYLAWVVPGADAIKNTQHVLGQTHIELDGGRARAETGATGPWLCGAYSVADVFFAPVAARIAGYNLPVSAAAQAYVDAHLAHPAFRRWRAMGLVDGPDQPFYDRPWPQRPWPGPAPLPAEACDGPSANEACPYSGKPVTHFARIQGRVIGFCNPFCRDKTVADPEAWPQALALLQP